MENAEAMMEKAPSEKPKSEKAMSEKAKSEKAKSEKSKKSSSSGGSFIMGRDEEPEMCCCFVCNMTPKKTKDLTCCCLVPIRCGVVLIGLATIALLLFLLVDVGYGLLNEYVHWSWTLVGVVLLVPMIIAVAFFIVFFSRETKNSRAKLWVGCQLTIISVSLLAIWNTVYYYYFYKVDFVLTGTSDVGYVKLTKKQFIVTQLYLATVVDFLFAYFLCVCKSYSNRMNKKEKAPPAMEAAKDMEAMGEAM